MLSPRVIILCYTSDMVSSTKRLHETAQPIFTVDTFIRYQDKILMFKRSETRKAFPGWWALPGGHIEDGENPLASAIREASEETGIVLTPEITQLKYVAIHHHLDRQELYVVFGFLAVLEHEPRVLLDNKEGTAQWIDKNSLPTLNVFPPIRYYFDHVLNNAQGVLYNNSIWENSLLVKVASEMVDKNS